MEVPHRVPAEGEAVLLTGVEADLAVEAAVAGEGLPAGNSNQQATKVNRSAKLILEDQKNKKERRIIKWQDYFRKPA